MDNTIRALCTVLCLAFGGVSHADEYIIFKRIKDNLGIDTLPHAYTVWHVDAIDYAKHMIEKEVSELPQDEAMEVAQQRLKEWGDGPLTALFLMSYAGREKMHKYGLTRIPSAVLVDESGKVIRRWEKIENGSELTLGDRR